MLRNGHGKYDGEIPDDKNTPNACEKVLSLTTRFAPIAHKDTDHGSLAMHARCVFSIDRTIGMAFSLTHPH